MVDKTQPERQRRYRDKLKAQLVKASLELPARIAELETENAELQRRLDEIALVSLSPVARAELDLSCAERGQTEAEFIDSILIHLANHRAKIVAKQEEQPAPAPAHVTTYVRFDRRGPKRISGACRAAPAGENATGAETSPD